MLAASISKGIIDADDMSLEEWQMAFAFFEGVEARITSPPPPVGCGYSPEEMAARLKDG